jgi:rhomboid protease GluP
MSEFLRKLAKSLGISYVWWHWRWLNFKKRWADFFSTDKNVVRHLKGGQKICRHCGALAGAGERICPVCGARLPSAAGNFLYKVFGLIAPGVSPATVALTTLIAADFVLAVVLSHGTALLSPRIGTLLRVGALDSELVAAGQWWRLLTCIFVHIGLIHILFNLFALLSVSNFLEEELGPARYLSVFLLTGLGGSLATDLLHFRVISAGASGAIFGLIGFSIIYFRRQGGARGRDIQGFMVRWAIYAFVFGLIFGADNYAHGGGLVTGLILGALMETREDVKQRLTRFWRVVAGLLTLALIASFVLLFLLGSGQAI